MNNGMIKYWLQTVTVLKRHSHKTPEQKYYDTWMNPLEL